MTFQPSGMLSSFLTFSSLKSPIQQEPTPIAQAATAIFCNAIAVSIFDHFPVIKSLYAQPTIVTGASLMNLLNIPPDNSFLISESVKTMKCQLSVCRRWCLSTSLQNLVQNIPGNLFLLVVPNASSFKDNIDQRHKLNSDMISPESRLHKKQKVCLALPHTILQKIILSQFHGAFWNPEPRSALSMSSISRRFASIWLFILRISIRFSTSSRVA